MNVHKTLYFLLRASESLQPDVLVNREKTTVVSDFKDLHPTFKKISTPPLNLANFQHRPYLTTEAAKLSMHDLCLYNIVFHKLLSNTTSLKTVPVKTIKTLDNTCLVSKM